MRVIEIDANKLRGIIFKCLEATRGQVIQSSATIGIVDGLAVRIVVSVDDDGEPWTLLDKFRCVSERIVTNESRKS